MDDRDIVRRALQLGRIAAALTARQHMKPNKWYAINDGTWARHTEEKITICKQAPLFAVRNDEKVISSVRDWMEADASCR